jgi:uncharacterized HAD superfamily protein
VNRAVKGFLRSEYDRVAEAHFKSIEAISTFFRHYLLIMAIPGATVGALVRLEPASKLELPLGLPLGLLLGLCLVVVALAGIGVCSYIINLRLDVLLYARTINGVRKAYYGQWRIPLEEQLRMRVLPWSPSRPEYFEGSYFLHVVLVFGLVDSSYLALAAWLLWSSVWPCTIAFCSFFLLHVLLYRELADIRAHRFLRPYAIGVDIDGVLNLQTQHFVEYLNRNEGLAIGEADIVVKPVHDQDGLGVSLEQERRVLNNPDYWSTMPSVDGAAKTLKRLRNDYALEVVLCTSRPWPAPGTKEQLNEFSRMVQGHMTAGRLAIDLDPSRRRRLMRRHTRQWLKAKGFVYDRLYLDKGSDTTYEPDSAQVNRFEIARRREIRYFVEDELKKAVKLSYICDVVFLISQPYNQPQESLGTVENRRRTHLPGNLVRVDGWDDIYQYLGWLM